MACERQSRPRAAAPRHISGRYPLDDTARALEDMAARRVTGKIVILPEP
jgi:ferric-dicitrate binding protein FerR (iron transport regulator)